MDIGDEAWINGRKIQLLIKCCVEHVVRNAETLEEIIENESLNVIFEELTKHQSAKDYVKYLFTDILETGFDMTSISE